MRYVEYLCLGGMEIANVNRTSAYLTELGAANFGSRLSDCLCSPALDDEYITYSTPDADDAPWYDANVPASAEFLGLWAFEIQDLPSMARDVNVRSGIGAVIGGISYAERLVQVKAYMFAQTPRGMMYGKSWLREALKGTGCEGCARDTLEVLPTCPDDADESHFRTLYNVGLIGTPTFIQVQDLPECDIMQVDFQLASGVPWLFGPAETCLDEDEIDAYITTQVCCITSTNTWPGDATTIITLEAQDGDVGEIVLYAKPTIEGECPQPELNRCWEVTVPLLEKNHVLQIDGIRQEATLYNPTSKVRSPGLPSLEFDGLLQWLDIPPCTDMCICVEAGSGSGTLIVSIDKYNREV